MRWRGICFSFLLVLPFLALNAYADSVSSLGTESGFAEVVSPSSAATDLLPGILFPGTIHAADAVEFQAQGEGALAASGSSAVFISGGLGATTVVEGNPSGLTTIALEDRKKAACSNSLGYYRRVAVGTKGGGSAGCNAIQVVPVPEPATLLLLATGLIGAVLTRRGMLRR